MSKTMIQIAPATAADADAIWDIIQAVIATGDTYTFAPDSSREKMLGIWLHPEVKTYVARVQAQVLGTFILKPNQLDLGSHIANASYMVHPQAQGQGVGRAMAEFSLQEAKNLGYRAMQFNIVLASNPAVNLWQKLGFEIIGTIPEAFQSASQGYIDAHIMYRRL